MAGWITDCGISQREFARQVHFPQPNLVKVIQGHRPPPLEHLPVWLAALELDQAAQDEALALALDAHGLAMVSGCIRRLRRDLDRAEQTLRKSRSPIDGAARDHHRSRHR
ncbi:MAG: helix-turn-helix domain-containing protein [Planctomycetota bacterium]